MNSCADAAFARVCAVLAQTAWLAFGLVVPLALASESGLASGTAVMVVGLVAALVVALARHSAGIATEAVTGFPTGSAEPVPLLSWRIPDPIHHPLRPRAPGLV
jgi:hypothetical protein